MTDTKHSQETDSNEGRNNRQRIRESRSPSESRPDTNSGTRSNTETRDIIALIRGRKINEEINLYDSANIDGMKEMLAWVEQEIVNSTTIEHHMAFNQWWINEKQAQEKLARVREELDK